MDLDLRFDGLPGDVVDAEVQVRVLDLAMADAPADTATATAPRFSVSEADPAVRVTVDLPTADAGYEPGLLVRVRGRTAGDELVEFLNTGATPLTGPSAGPVQVVLSRIR
ncbi:MAG TPA: hypothetical protein VK402_08965 [Blastococcus sp.]|nr:hypothetical protein [Blastococcus sp.]